MGDDTLPPSASEYRTQTDHAASPGLVVVFANGAATARVMDLGAGAIELGRGVGQDELDDGRVSRRHARVELDHGRWMITDLGSQNGTFVDGNRIGVSSAVPLTSVLRLGDSLLLPCEDIRPVARLGVCTVDGFIRGPSTQTVIEMACRALQVGTVLHIRGETGTGKEGIATTIHRAGSRKNAALVPVNCAAIPDLLAERLLFGVRRGAYSGADADASGYVAEADGGTLFLDEVGELEAGVQKKLLRVLESREVLPLGAVKARKIDFALCTATNKDLASLVTAERFREDLYFRIGKPCVTVPPLRDRREEIPALICDALDKLPGSSTAHVSFVERCLMRPWPGNVRDLLNEIRVAAQSMPSNEHRVTARHLSPTAGSALHDNLAAVESRRAGWIDKDDPLLVDRVAAALRAAKGNVTAAAASLDLKRGSVRNIIKRHNLAPERDRPARTRRP